MLTFLKNLNLYINVSSMKGEIIILGKRIRYFRQLRDLTQAELGEKIGVTRQAVASWEDNKRVPDIMTGRDIAKALDITMEDLTGKDDSELPTPIPATYRFLGTVTVEKDGKIKLPKSFLEEMGIKRGDQMLVLADVERGVEFLPMDILWKNMLGKYFY